MSIIQNSLNFANTIHADGKTSTLGLILLDAAGLVSAAFLALALNSDQSIGPSSSIGRLLLLFGLAELAIFAIFKMYKVSLSNFDFEDMVNIFSAVSLSSVIFVSISLLMFGGKAVNIAVEDYLFSLVFIGGIRASRRACFRILRRGRSRDLRRVLIAGAGSAGKLTLEAMFQEEKPECFPVGFIDDDPTKQGLHLHGVPVLGKTSDLPRLIASQQVEELLIAMPSASPSVLKNIIQTGQDCGLKKIRVLPALNRLVSGKVAVSDLRDIRLEDILGRDSVRIDTGEIGRYLKGKTVLITGAAGSIGSELCRQIVAFQPERLIALDQEETGLFQLKQELNLHSPALNLSLAIADVRDSDRIRNVFKLYYPDVVFHAAAYKHVSMMEENPEEAVTNNVVGSAVISKAACQFGAEKFVFISTDKAVNPTCIMGATKRLAETVIQTLNNRGSCRFVAVRFGNVLGSRGSVVPIFREQIQRGGPVTVTHPEMRRYFMTPSEAALLVFQAGAIGNGGEIFVLDMGAPVSILDLARQMIRLAGLEPDKDISIVFTGALPGEKMFEDILTAEEGTTATTHERIYIAKSKRLPASREALEAALVQLEHYANDGDRNSLMGLLLRLVPGFEHPNPASEIVPANESSIKTL